VFFFFFFFIKDLFIFLQWNVHYKVWMTPKEKSKQLLVTEGIAIPQFVPIG